MANRFYRIQFYYIKAYATLVVDGVEPWVGMETAVKAITTTQDKDTRRA